MTAVPQSQSLSRVAGVHSGASRLCAPVYADSSVLALAIRLRDGRLNRSGCRVCGQMPGAQTDGRGISPLPVILSECGHFPSRKTQPAKWRGRKWPLSRLLPMRWPGEASRPIALSWAICGASRPPETFCRLRARSARCFVEERSDEVAPADPRAIKPLNVVDGWIGIMTFERDATLSARGGSERHAERDVRTNL
ncbi:MAG TPA: hypothetical protein VHY30_05270 [Verrucomicrobiae bacterium]|jgi:hypothetical protein|nr:hypothetical protein [Verrucomicrobiae bacterium]